MRHLLILNLVFGLILSGFVQAQDDLIITELSPLDNQYMDQQREGLQNLARLHLGRSFNAVKENDLALLQALLDQQLVQGDQKRELQAMGIIMGDLLAAELDMHWVIYEDELGRSRALRYRKTDHYLFPVTMISRRREVDNTDPVKDIYQKAYGIIDAVREPLPFQ